MHLKAGGGSGWRLSGDQGTPDVSVGMGATENEPERRVAPRMPPPKAAPVRLLRPVGPAPVPNGVKATDGLHVKT